MIGFIYVITNRINGKIYIGQTKVSVEVRWKEHLRHSKNGEQLINRAMRKYGNNNFYIRTLEALPYCTQEALDFEEEYYIKLFDSTNKSIGYNVSLGGNTPKFERKILDPKIVADLYINKQYTLEKIANMYNVTRYIVTTTLKNVGISIRKRSESSSKFNKIPVETLKKYLQQYGSLQKAAKASGVKYSTFRNACIYNHIEYNSPKSTQHQKQ